MGLAVRTEVIGNKIIVAVFDDGVDEGRKGRLVAKHALLDGVKHLFQFRVEFVFAVIVGVAEVFDVFGQVAKEEDVLVAGFTRDFDL